MSNSTLVFGTGVIYAEDAPVGIVQNVTLDIAASVKTLFGSNIFPEAIGVATHQVTGSIGTAVINSEFLPRFMFGTDMQSGSLQRVEEPAAVPASPGPYTVVVDQAADFERNVAVINVSNGQHLKIVASSPTAGQYAVNPTTGTYTFAAADAGLAILIRYDINATGGRHFEMRQRRMGQQYPFMLTMSNDFQGKAYMLTINQCVLTKQSLAAKNDDFGIPALEYSAFVNDAGILGRFDFSSET